MNEERFSRRFGFPAEESEITIREDAPGEIRQAAIQIPEEMGLDPKEILERCAIHF